MDLSALLAKVQNYPPNRLAIAAAEDPAVLRTAIQAHTLGIAEPILCGSVQRMQAIAQEYFLDLSPFTLIEASNPIQAAQVAVSLVRDKKADVLMKGFLHTADLLRAVLHKENGLRTGNTLSHVSIIPSKPLQRTLFSTDASMVMYPDLLTKADLIRNAVEVAHSFGIETPRVAVLAAVEVINPDMPATLDAAALTMMNRRGQIRGCIVDGPLAFDLAISPEAALHKGVDSEVAGKADVLVFHNIEAGNSTLKALTFGGGQLSGGLIMGAIAPIALTSRADPDEAKLYSIASSALVQASKNKI